MAENEKEAQSHHRRRLPNCLQPKKQNNCMQPTRTPTSANINSSSKSTIPTPTKDPTTPLLAPSSPLLDEAHNVDMGKEETHFAEDTTVDMDKEEDGSDLLSRP
jgi:hypothetical protein